MGACKLHLRKPLKAGACLQGIGTLRLLHQIEDRTGRPIADLFDLICGTSTGGILATALALKRLTLTDCEDIYRCRCSMSVFLKSHSCGHVYAA